MDTVESLYGIDNLLHTEEYVLGYRLGGFHPVCLGDTFQHGRYQIYHKLGWGGSSTVWLAKDNKYIHTYLSWEKNETF